MAAAIVNARRAFQFEDIGLGLLPSIVWRLYEAAPATFGHASLQVGVLSGTAPQ
jgi:hypothetical protein